MDNDCFFIFGAPRSGTTFLSQVLDCADNACVYTEQSPKLGYESREKHLGRFDSFDESKNFIKVQKDQFIKQTNEKGLIYGDKNPNFLPFLLEMEVAWPASKFIFIYRDGRDVVTSLLNWNESGKKVFQTVEDIGHGGTKYPVQNLWDYSRIRPLPHEKYHEEWREFTLFEKCCIYWSYYNENALHQLSKIDEARYMHFDVTHSSEDDYERLFHFLNLNGYDKDKIIKLKNEKVNSLSSATENRSKFKNWRQWSKSEKDLYEKYSSQMHTKLFKSLSWD